MDVHLDGVAIEGDGVAANQEDRFASGGACLAERRERLSEALAGLGLRSIAPQEGREPFPGTGPARREREVREQRHGLLRDIEWASGGETPVDLPKEP